jgi:hypothetical protein
MFIERALCNGDAIVARQREGRVTVPRRTVGYAGILKSIDAIVARQREGRVTVPRRTVGYAETLKSIYNVSGNNTSIAPIGQCFPMNRLNNCS